MDFRIKVLRVIYDLQIGGVQRMLLKTLPLLREQGIHTEVCCLKKQGELAEQFIENGFPVHVNPFHSRLDPIGLWRLRRHVIERGFSIVHAHMYASNIAVNAALFGTRRIRIINSYHSLRPFHGRTQLLMGKLTKGIPDCWIAVSDSVRSQILKAGIPASKVIVIHNGVVCPPEPIPFPERNPESPLELFWAGRFVKQKRVDMLIEIASLCLKEGIPVHLTLVGNGPLYVDMAQKIVSMGINAHITLTGWKSDIQPYIDASDLYLSASNREGFPNTLLEACARGRGFAVADIPPNCEVLGSSKAGYVISDKLTDCVQILKTISGNRSELKRIGEDAFRLAQQYKIENVCQKTAELYDNLCRSIR